MSLATVRSRALDGLNAAEVTIEVHLANGLPAFTLVGLAETEVKESRERVRAALQNSGLAFPHNKRVQCSQEDLSKSELSRARPAGLPSLPDWGGARLREGRSTSGAGAQPQ